MVSRMYTVWNGLLAEDVWGHQSTSSSTQNCSGMPVLVQHTCTCTTLYMLFHVVIFTFCIVLMWFFDVIPTFVPSGLNQPQSCQRKVQWCIKTTDVHFFLLYFPPCFFLSSSHNFKYISLFHSLLRSVVCSRRILMRGPRPLISSPLIFLSWWLQYCADNS